MKVIGFENSQCNRIRLLLDSYLNDELLVETNHEVLKHLENCEGCARSLEKRAQLRSQLKRAVMNEEAPPELRARIRNDIRRQRGFGSAITSLNSPWMIAAAAAVLLGAIALGVFFRPNSESSRLTPKPLSLAAEVAPDDEVGKILKVGFDDHVFCAIDHGMAGKQFTAEQISQQVGPTYQGLVAVVSSKLGGAYTVVVGHRCHYQKREFVHLILRGQDQVVSLIVTQKTDEAFPPGGAAAVLRASGVPLYEATWSNLQVTGMETRDHLIFLVSNGTKAETEQLASNLALVVNDFVRQTEA